MEISMTLNQNPDRLFKILQADLKPAQRAGMTNWLTTVEALSVKNAPHRTSNLARTRTSNVNDDGSKGTLAFTAPYSEFVHEGTGLFGPHKTKIVPKTKQALYWPGARHPVRSTKGMRGNPFVRKANDSVHGDDLYRDGMQNYLSHRGY
jgi:hypothetical protein